jgi:NADPH:quinone reductase-like Zn-dependent oxidoreductase
MKAVTVSRFGGPENLELVDLPLPEPGPRSVRIRLAASCVQPIDLSTRAGRMTEAGLLAPAERVGLGWDVAGVVEALGPGVERFAPGDRVVGLRDLMFEMPGAHAEYVVLDERAVAPAPVSATLTDAATLPLTGLTADGALEQAGLAPGETLLVTGAAGGVGRFVLELAALRDLTVIAVASPGDEALVRSLGAAELIARDEPLAAAARRIAPGGVDAVIDAAVLGITAHDALRGGGTFVALVRPFAPPPIRGTRVVVHEVHADGARLGKLVELVDAGKLTLRVHEVLPLDDVAAAHARLEAGGIRGRLVLEP